MVIEFSRIRTTCIQRKKKNRKQMWVQLPEDIIVNILSRLPVKSILRFRSVCKPWCDQSHNPDFVKIHLNHAITQNNFSVLFEYSNRIYYPIDYDSSSSSSSSSSSYGNKVVEMVYPFKCLIDRVNIWGSYNGLLCLSTGSADVICLWNPSTKQYKNIPSLPPNKFGIRNAMRAYVFGYDCKIKDYMLVRILSDKSNGVLQVFTLGSNSWRSIENFPYRITARKVVLFNGAIHWINSWSDADVVVSYDIGDERFQEVPLPEHFDDDKYKTRDVCVLEECLCLIDHGSSAFTEVWVMKEYGVRESWTKLFTIDHQTIAGSVKYLMLIQSFENGELLLKKDDDNALVLYNPNHEKARILKIHGIPEFSLIWAYLGTLVSVNTDTSLAQEETNDATELKEKVKINKKRSLGQ